MLCLSPPLPKTRTQRGHHEAPSLPRLPLSLPCCLHCLARGSRSLSPPHLTSFARFRPGDRPIHSISTPPSFLYGISYLREKEEGGGGGSRGRRIISFSSPRGGREREGGAAAEETGTKESNFVTRRKRERKKKKKKRDLVEIPFFLPPPVAATLGGEVKGGGRNPIQGKGKHSRESGKTMNGRQHMR